MKIPNSISDLWKAPAILLSQYKRSDLPVLGYTCNNIPEELIIAAGLQPFRISNVGANQSALTPSFTCPFASATLENMLKLEEFFSGFAIAHTCDPMWRLYDILKKKISKPLFLLRPPHNTDNELSLSFLRLEFNRFKEFLDKNFEARIDDDSLSKSIKLCNETRDLLKGIYLLNEGVNCKISGFDRFQLVLAGMWMRKAELNSLLKALVVNNEKACDGVRVHVNGTVIYDLNLIKAIGESGGFVASDDLCTGSRYFWNNVEDSQDHFSALAHRYLKKPLCPAQDPLHRRLGFIDDMVEKFQIQGVVTFAEKFCDPIFFDSVHIRNNLAKKGIPSLFVDYENPTQEIGRIRTRLEAFIESVGGGS
ncbi:MAG: 2-hydroxyacyl-CoA dehydratase [Candidatus Bathyarchaeota archaeon]|nr:MAG: 2-hydroxyacyl-CoA dehydratase [Candidatus Bathyarchaeota archaeon]